MGVGDSGLWECLSFRVSDRLWTRKVPAIRRIPFLQLALQVFTRKFHFTKVVRRESIGFGFRIHAKTANPKP